MTRDEMTAYLHESLNETADRYPLTADLRGSFVQIVSDIMDQWESDFNRCEAERLRLQTELDNAKRQPDPELPQDVVGEETREDDGGRV